MAWWLWTLNIVVILLAPILIYVLISVEDLLDWIDLGTLLPVRGGMRGLILIFCLVSVLFYIIFIFHEIKESNNQEVKLQQTLVRISIAAFTCIIFFTIVYTSIYKLFGQSSFEGKGIGEDLLSHLYNAWVRRYFPNRQYFAARSNYADQL